MSVRWYPICIPRSIDNLTRRELIESGSLGLVIIMKLLRCTASVKFEELMLWDGHLRPALDAFVLLASQIDRRVLTA